MITLILAILKSNLSFSVKSRELRKILKNAQVHLNSFESFPEPLISGKCGD